MVWKGAEICDVQSYREFIFIFRSLEKKITPSGISTFLGKNAFFWKKNV